MNKGKGSRAPEKVDGVRAMVGVEQIFEQMIDCRHRAGKQSLLPNAFLCLFCSDGGKKKRTLEGGKKKTVVEND